METGRVTCVLTSPDAGTRETYKKIKQVDCFDRFVSNLKKYPLDKVISFQMKYIFLDGINDNKEDVDGFCEIAKETYCKKIAISSDCFKPYTENIRKLVSRLIKKAHAAGIIVYPDSYIAPEDKKFVEDCYAKLQKETASDKYFANITENGKCIIYNPSASGVIDGEGELELNANLVPGSNAECIISLGKNSKLIVNGNLLIEPNSIIELDDNAILTAGDTIIGRGTSIKCKNTITIGNNVKIAPNCFITDECDSNSGSNKSKKAADKPLIISDNVNIGYGTVISRGVKIGKNAFIEPNSTVAKNVAANTKGNS